MKVLFLNACARKESRTLALCQYFLEGYQKLHPLDEIERIDLCLERELLPIDEERLTLRNQLIREQNWDHPMFRFAKSLKEADKVILGAPYWDWSFPSIVKVYIENIFVEGLMFRYEAEGSVGFCKGQKLLYIATAGGYMEKNLGYEYIDRVSRELGKFQCDYLDAQGLDIIGTNVDEKLAEAKKKIDQLLPSW